jgi:hypothetical protein
VERDLSDPSVFERSDYEVAVADHSLSIEEVRDLVHRALFAMVVGDVEASDLFTHDVKGDSPNMYVRSRIALEDQLSDRAGGLSNVEFTLDRVEEAGDGWLATWRVSGEHTGTMLLNEDVFFAPSGHRIALSAETQFLLQGRRIREFQTSYDDEALVAQLRGGQPRGSS